MLNIGGIAAEGNLNNCDNNVKIIANESNKGQVNFSCGGIVGTLNGPYYHGIVDFCYNFGDIFVAAENIDERKQYINEIVGFKYSLANQGENCYNYGNIVTESKNFLL